MVLNRYKKTSGAALLIMLTIFVLALTTVAVNRMSINSVQTERKIKDQQLLQETADAVKGFVYMQVFNGNSTVNLPCPDSDSPPDGQSNSPCGNGSSGALPYRDFNLLDQYDRCGLPVQYELASTTIDCANTTTATAVTLTVRTKPDPDANTDLDPCDLTNPDSRLPNTLSSQGLCPP